MSPALVISPNPQVVGMVQQAWGPDGYAIAPSQFPATMAALMQELQGAPMPEVAVLDPGDQIQEALALATELSVAAAIPVVLVSEEGAELGLPALRAGVRLETLEQLLAQLRLQEDKPETPERSTVPSRQTRKT